MQIDDRDQIIAELRDELARTVEESNKMDAEIRQLRDEVSEWKMQAIAIPWATGLVTVVKIKDL